ncbi:hypothetical protein E4U53_002788 [Claviceps sorghi]|nr:hypothetical protein E4U53_002788 [Claviceps sorghi]
MAMSLSLLHHQSTLTLIAGFENGSASVHRLCPSTGTWILTYRSQVHSQPILSLDVRLDHGSNNYSFFTSGADAIIAKHPVPSAQQEIATTPVLPRGRTVPVVEQDASTAPHGAPSLLSRALHKDGDDAAGLPSKTPTQHTTLLQEWKHAKKVVNTRHSGQQSLEVRSDGSIFATAGWDSKIRVYSCKTMRELAVLKWHKEGAYAVTFSHVGAPPSTVSRSGAEGADEVQEASDMDVSRLSVTDRRSHRVRTAHWIAAGAKDGRVSLWDIY